VVTREHRCEQGCAADGIRCGHIDVSNRVGPDLVDAEGEPAVTIPGGATIATDSGVVLTGDGAPLPIRTRIQLQHASAELRIYLAGAFTVGSVRVT
jgi:hypothetical protein